jgi:hypothetical protein
MQNSDGCAKSRTSFNFVLIHHPFSQGGELTEVWDENPGNPEGFKKNNFLLLTLYLCLLFDSVPSSLGDLMKEAEPLPPRPRLSGCYSSAGCVV